MKKTWFSALTLSIAITTTSLPAGASLPGTVGLASGANDTPTYSLAPTLEKVLPAVVSIIVKGKKEVAVPQLPEPFRFFFGQEFPPGPFSEYPFEGLGSGVIIDATKGYVVTNHHVVKSASEIRIQLNDGRERKAALVGGDEETDIALLQVENPIDLTAIEFADSDKLRIGDFTLAVGNPFGIGQTATSGIVSALAREVNEKNLKTYIQTDAAINNGNSGGALINIQGKLIGINTAIIGPGGGNVGIGLAIPSNIVKSLIGQIVEHGKVRRVQLGVMGGSLTSDVAKSLKISLQHGVFVSQVVPQSAAEAAGIRVGDIITAVNEEAVNNLATLRSKIVTMGPGKSVDLSMFREGKSFKLKVLLKSDMTSLSDAKSLFPGLEGSILSDDETSGEPGIKVESVRKNSPAAHFGLKENDLITAVNKTAVANIGELRKVLASKPEVVALTIKRGKSAILVILS